ncbi:hypothetical protein C8Q78DRAFT_657551 [Trametes maxima]|nr:hypothetical protein C8Q78DRAFT_681692 [Trametes maxima]KAI0673875.1 hypothetical protein C8Q78DRAFT_657551 [Trametes maxima]
MSTTHAHPSAATTTGRAPYGPPALRIFTQRQAPQPTNAQIAEERFRQRFKIRFDEQSDNITAGNNALHPHFCTSSEDRQFAFSEAMGDIEDAAIGAARTADTLFLGFGIRPEWAPSRLLRASEIDVRVVTTRQFQQTPAFRRALEKIHKIVQEEIALPHILAFHDKLDTVTPGAGYAFDPETRRMITQPIRLASDTELPGTSALHDVPPPNTSQRVSSSSTPSRPSTTSTRPQPTSVPHRGSHARAAAGATEPRSGPPTPTRLRVPSARSGRPTPEEITAEIHAHRLSRIVHAAARDSSVPPSATTAPPTTVITARGAAPRPAIQVEDDPPPPYSPSRERCEEDASSNGSPPMRISAQKSFLRWTSMLPTGSLSFATELGCARRMRTLCAI